MKKLIIALAVIILSVACSNPALATPVEPVLYDASKALGYETHYFRYDESFYEAEDAQSGHVEKLKYTTTVYGKEMNRWVNVYLPNDYSAEGTERYPVIYFFHGGGCDQKTIRGNPFTVNALNHMISNGDAPPFILVAPTYYYNAREKLHDPDLFAQELLQDIMPTVEHTYRTYAETADIQGFAASRDKRAICGFSTGSGYVWHLFPTLIPYARWYLPCSGAAVTDKEYAALLDTAARNAGQFFIYLSSGGHSDVAYPHCVELSRRLRQESAFIYGTDRGSNFFYSLSDNEHLDNCTRYYLYNAFRDGLFTES